ncbi:MGH1-like glycoside hydrolase domain-containing protein [uncultured Cellulomonas sp.]|uniref:MGH1-like glycoside hydrolase domain-containing protein n=1 Tax=uncultured Cellulomonas sp. TaxID=189682 RepID=UPI0028E7E4CA|nr:hypothetical protein [uncultured Cellulomonas sp.]
MDLLGLARRETCRRPVAVKLAAIVALVVGLSGAPSAAFASTDVGTGCDPALTSGSYADATGTAVMTVTHVSDDCRRSYRLETSRTDTRRFTEVAGKPTLRSGSVLLDGLYALAVDEARANEVDVVSDPAYDGGAPIACGNGCYQTGKDWSYVWTRDVAYSADLGLAALDPERMRDTLLFKLSERRDGSGGTQIVQDTGTGGSYPNSTDRVTWVMGALEVLDWLPDSERQAFAAQAYEAIVNTVEHDRRVIHDPKTGLYRGEQSFLDWREQSYPAWTADDVADIAMSESLSTNVVHWIALDAAALLARDAGHGEAAARYRGWADDLLAAVRERLWLPGHGQFSQMLTTTLDQSPVDRFDALGTSLAVVTGIATPDQAQQAVQGYPFTPYGPPVLWPQQQGIGAYHNLGIWPFVSAYLARAAAQTHNDAAVAASAESMIRSAALFGSNLENMNVLTGGTETPINSERQLWSVAGMLSLVQHTTFGIDARPDGLHVAPFFPAQLRQRHLPGSDRLTLSGVEYQGHQLDVNLQLPASDTATGAYTVTGMALDGQELATGTAITAEMLDEGTSTLEVRLGQPTQHAETLVVVDATDPEALYGPRTPAVSWVAPSSTGDRLEVGIDLAGEDPARVRLDVLRDGEIVASDLEASEDSFAWLDQTSTGLTRESYCYSVRLRYRSSGTTSQHAKPQCYWGQDYSRVEKRTGVDFEATGGVRTENANGVYYRDWGTRAGDALTAHFRPQATGDYLFQVQAAVGGSLTSGVSSGVTMARIRDEATGDLVAEGVLVMSHTGSWSAINGSSFLPVHLRGGSAYSVTLSGDPLAVNMSYFRANSLYESTRNGPSNFADVYAMQLLLTSADPG